MGEFIRACPRCGDTRQVELKVSTWITIHDQQPSRYQGDVEYDNDSPAECGCGWRGRYGDLDEVDDGEDDEV
jgi:hypothetical protein